jgi:hypothetical protein
VLRHRRAAHGQATSDLHHRQWPLREPFENGTTRGIPEGVELSARRLGA